MLLGYTVTKDWRGLNIWTEQTWMVVQQHYITRQIPVGSPPHDLCKCLSETMGQLKVPNPDLWPLSDIYTNERVRYKGPQSLFSKSFWVIRCLSGLSSYFMLRIWTFISTNVPCVSLCPLTFLLMVPETSMLKWYSVVDNFHSWSIIWQEWQKKFSQHPHLGTQQSPLHSQMHMPVLILT